MLSSVVVASTVVLSSVEAQKAPHVLLMVADDYGHNDVGYNQNTKMPFNPEGKQTTDHVIHTPVIDELAADGVILSNYYVQPVCSPTRGVIMTGRYPSHTGIGPAVIGPTNPYGMPLDETYLPQVLKRVGYRTAAIGKWHLGYCTKEYTPTFRGFDFSAGYLYGKENYYNHSFDEVYFGYDFRLSDMESANVFPSADAAHDPRYEGVYSTQIYTNWTRDLVNYHSEKYSSNPLFLYLAWQSVHFPLMVPARYEAPYQNITNQFRRTLAGMVAAMDESIGDVVSHYKAAGMWDDTVLIFTTDNGGNVQNDRPQCCGGNNFPLRGGKHYAWEGGMRGVGFVRGTNNPSAAPLPKGVISMGLMHASDWLPTVARLAGVKGTPATTNPLDGFDAWDLLSGAADGTGRQFIAHNIPAAEHGLGGAFRMGDLKLMYSSGAMQVIPGIPQWVPSDSDVWKNNSLICPAPKEAFPASSKGVGTYLFNITADPFECNNLLLDANEDTSQLFQAIEGAFLKYQTDSKVPAVRDLHHSHGRKSKYANPANLPGDAWGPFIGGCH